MPGLIKSVLAVLVSQLVFQPRTLQACSCVVPGPVTDEFSNSDAVFVGTVVAHRALLDTFGESAVTFEVETSWKGVTGQRVEVQTSATGGACGVPVTRGERFIVFANQYNSDLFMSICSRTASDPAAIEQYQAEIEATGAQPLTLINGNDPRFPPTPVGLCGVGASSAALMTCLAFCFIRTSAGLGRATASLS